MASITCEKFYDRYVEEVPLVKLNLHNGEVKPIEARFEKKQYRSKDSDRKLRAQISSIETRRSSDDSGFYKETYSFCDPSEQAEAYYFRKFYYKKNREDKMKHTMKVASLKLGTVGIQVNRFWVHQHKLVNFRCHYPTGYKRGLEFLTHLSWVYEVSREQMWKIVLETFIERYILCRGINYNDKNVHQHLVALMASRGKKYSNPHVKGADLLHYCIIKHFRIFLGYITFDPNWKMEWLSIIQVKKPEAEAQMKFWELFSLTRAISTFSDIANIMEKARSWFDSYIVAFFRLIGFDMGTDSPFCIIFRSIAIGVATVMLFQTIKSITDGIWYLIRLMFEGICGVSLYMYQNVQASLQVLSPCETIVTLFSMMYMACTKCALNMQQQLALSRFTGSVTSGFVDMLKPFINWCCVNILGIEGFLGDNELPSMMKFLERAIEFTTRDGIDQAIVVNLASAQECVALWREYTGFRKFMLSDKTFSTNTRAEMNKLGKRLESLFLHAVQNSHWIHSRMEAIGILFSGPPGQGKTTAEKAFFSALHAKIRKNAHLFKNLPKCYEQPYSASQLYVRTAGSEYWEGYAGQNYCAFHEMYCEKDISRRLITASEWLRCVESATYGLNMAEVTLKGVVHFTSQIVLGTTNCTDFGNIGLESPSAFVRRIHFPLHVTMNEKVTDKKDLDKAWVFTPTQYNPAYAQASALGMSKFCNKPMVFSELVEAVFQEYLLRSQGLNLNDSFENFDWDSVPPLVPPVGSGGSAGPNSPPPPDNGAGVGLKIPEAFAQMYNDIDDYVQEVFKKSSGERYLSDLYVPTDPRDEVKEKPFWQFWKSDECKTLKNSEISYDWVLKNSKYIAPYRYFRGIGGIFLRDFVALCIHDFVPNLRSKFHRYQNPKEFVICRMVPSLDMPKWMEDMAVAAVEADEEMIKELNVIQSEANQYTPLETYFAGLVEHLMTVYWRTIHKNDGTEGEQWGFYKNQYIDPASYHKRFEEQGIFCSTQEQVKIGHIMYAENTRFQTFWNPHDLDKKVNPWKDPNDRRFMWFKIENRFPHTDLDGFSTFDRSRLAELKFDYFHTDGEILNFTQLPTYPLTSQNKVYHVPNLVGQCWDDIIRLSQILNHQWGPILVKILAFGGFAIIAGTVYNLFDSWWKEKPEDMELVNDEEVNYIELTGSSDLQAFYQKHNSGPKRFKYKQVRLETAESQVHESHYTRFVNMGKNSRAVKIEDGKGMVLETNGFFGTPKEMYLPGHAYYAIHALRLTLANVDGTMGTVYSPSEYTVRSLGEDRDGVILTFQTAVPSVVNLKNQFPSNRVETVQVPFRLMKLKRNNERDELVTIMATGNKGQFVDESLSSSGIFAGKTYRVQMRGYYLVKDGKGLSGFCGFPWISSDNVHQNHPILGAHVARLGNDSIVCPLYSSDFISIIDTKNAFAQLFSPDEYTVGPPGTLPYNKCKVTTHIGGKNPLEKTLLSPHLPDVGVAPCVLEPVVDHEGVKQFPLANAYQRYLNHEHRPMPDVLAEGLKDPHNIFRGLFPDGYVYKKIDFETALFGDGVNIEPIDASRSNGFPDVQVNGKSKKRDYMDMDEKTYDPKLREDVERQLDDWSKGVFHEHIVVDHLKGELKDKAKIYKPRLFCGDGVRDMICIKILLGDFLAHTKHYRHRGASCVGYNPHSYDWTALGRKLFRFGRDRVVGGDISSLDLSVLRFFSYVLYQCLKYHIGFQDNTPLGYSMEAVCYLLVTTVHLSGHIAYMCDFRNSSGNFLTCFFNTVVTWVCLWCIYNYKRPNNLEIDFQEGVALGVFGDDNLGSVSPLVTHFNNNSIQKGFLDLFGMTYTDPNKGLQMDPFLAEESQIFLARRFVERDFRYDGPLEFDSLFGMLHYVDPSSSTMEQQTMQNVDTAKRELTHFSPEEIIRYETIIDEAVRKVGYTNTSLSVNGWLARRLEVLSEGFTISSM